MKSLQDFVKKEEITLFGWTHSTLTKSRSFFFEMGCHESYDEEDFLEQPRESDSVLSGWICLWYPKQVFSDEKKMNNYLI